MLNNIRLIDMRKIGKSFIILYSLVLSSLIIDVQATETLEGNRNNSEKISQSNLLKFKEQLIVHEEQINPNIIEKLKNLKRRKNNQKIGLYDLEDIIKNNSDDLKVMSSRIEEARFLLKSEISAWYPDLNLSSTGFPQYLNGNTSNQLSTNTSSSQTKASLKATLKWDVINPSRVSQIAAARDEFENSRIAYSIKYLDLLLEARSQFFKLQQSLQDIRIAKDSLKTSTISLKEASIKLKSGLGSKFDLLEARTQLSKDKQLLIEKLGTRKINEKKFSKILNLESHIIPVVDSMPKIIGLWEASLEESINSGYEYREEIDQLLIQISIKNNQAKQALGSSKPTVSIYNTIDSSIAEGEIAVASPRGNNSINNFTTTVGLQFQWQLFDGGSSKAKYNAKKEKVKEIEAQLALKKAEIKNEIEEIFIKMNVTKQNIQNSYDAIQSAKESLRLSLLRLQAGIATQREVFNNQKDLTQAEVNHIKAITEYNESIISLQRRTGINEFKKCSIKDQLDDSLIENQQLSSITLTKDPCMELL